VELLSIRILATAPAKYLTSQELPVSNCHAGEAPKHYFFFPGETFLKG